MRAATDSPPRKSSVVAVKCNHLLELTLVLAAAYTIGRFAHVDADATPEPVMVMSPPLRLRTDVTTPRYACLAPQQARRLECYSPSPQQARRLECYSPSRVWYYPSPRPKRTALRPSLTPSDLDRPLVDCGPTCGMAVRSKRADRFISTLNALRDA